MPRVAQVSMLVSLGVACAATTPTFADTIVLPPSDDTYLSERVDQPAGGFSEMVIGTQGSRSAFARNRGLIRFDGLSQIPPGSTITSATLTLTMNKAPLGPAADFEAHRLLVEWNGALSTWATRLEAGETWAAPGGAEGVDYLASSSSHVLVPGTGVFVLPSTPALIADVSSWVDDPATNKGWLIKTLDETIGYTARRVAASESFAGAPQLEVQFLSSHPVLSSVTLSAGNICFSFGTRPDKAYVVERSATFEPGSWTAITNIPANPAATQALVCDPLGLEQYFYRVAEK